MKRWFYKKETSSKTASKTGGNTTTWTKTWAHLKTCSVGFQIGFWIAFLCLPVLSAFAQQANLPCNSVTSTPFIPPTITGTLSQTTSTAGVGAVYWESSAGCILGLPLGCGSTRVPANVINSSTTDFARVNLAVGLGLSATMRVTEATNTYSTGNFAGYLIDNASLVSAGLLNAITVKTYNNGTLVETSSSGSLIGVSSSLVAGKYEVGFYTTQAFDAIEVTFNSVAGLAVVYDVYYPVVRKYCAGPNLACNTKTVLAKNTTPALSFPVEIEYPHTGISGIAIATITNTESAISQSTTDFASILFPVGIGSANLAVKDHFTTYTAGHFVGFDIENITALGAGLFNSTIITTYLNGVQRETASGSSLAISAGLLSGSGRQTVGFVNTMSFDEIKITLNQNGLSLGTTKIYGAVFQKFCAATIACNQTYSLSSPDYPVLIDGALTGLSGVACLGCSVSNTENIITANTTDYATITVLAGLGASGAIAVQDALYTYPAGTTAGFTIKDANSLLQLDLFGALTMSTYNNGVFQESKTATDLLDFALLTNWVGLGSGAYTIGFTATLPFDEMRLSVGSLASALNIIQVYGAYVNTATSYGGTLLCAATFNFNCGAATSTGTFEATGLGGQTGTLTVPITNATAGSAAFTVTGSGFTGELITPLSVGQTSVTIPITFNGSGSTGLKTLTVNCISGTGSCTPSVEVLVANSGCVLSLPSLLPFGSVLSIPNFCLKGVYNYYKASTGALQDLLALNANGNVFNPISVVVDATNTGTHSLTSGGNTTALAQRMLSIQASGTFSVNGGIKVRIYYNPTEFASLPLASRRWFKHPAHTKATVLADLTPTGLTNAVFLTPDSVGIENGLSFVEFFHIQSFSTFGYMGTMSPENCTNGIDDDGDGLIDCDDPDCGKPSVSSLSKTDPSVASCPTLNNGSISVTAIGSNLRYSKNGGTNWQVSNSFNGLTGGTTTIRIQDSVSTCVLDTAIVLTAPTCVTCATPSVGGTTTYSGGTVCSTANMGTLTLSGQTGDVVKWQTSTNGGTSWTDIAASDKPSYSFINAANNQQYRAIVNSGSGCVDAFSTVTTIVTSLTACTTNTCSYTSGAFTPSVTVSPNPIYTTHVVLVNPTTGVMTYVTSANTTAFTGVAVGDYMMYVLSYDTTQATPPTITAGLNISTLTGCFAVSDPLLTKVCCPTIAAPTVSITQPACGGTTGTITVTAPSSGVTYSFDNGTTYQASATSSALAADSTYQVLVKDNSSNCVSTATATVINAQPATPVISSVSKTDPSVASCPSLNDGTITVTATGSNLHYSKDNGATWQASNQFTGLVAGSYAIKLKDSVSTCEVTYPSNPVVLTASTCNVAPVLTSAATATTSENVSTTTPVYTATATDANVGQTQTYSFETGGADNALFTIDPTTGEVKFIASPDFEAPTDANTDNIYEIKVKVCDNGTPQYCGTKDVAITVTNVVEVVNTLCTTAADNDAIFVHAQNSPYGKGIVKISNISTTPSAPNALELAVSTVNSSGLTISKNLNGSSGYNFYVAKGFPNPDYHWYNGTAWQTTGHLTGFGVNPGGGMNAIFNFNGYDKVTKYTGTGNAVDIVTNVPIDIGNAYYDVAVDSMDNFYVFMSNAQKVYKYNASGVKIDSFTTTGAPTGIQPGFAWINGKMFCLDGTGKLYQGIITGSNVNFTLHYTFPHSGFIFNDLATCPTSSAPVVSTVICMAGTTAPILSGTTISNTCPATTVNLNTLLTSTTPSGARLRWHTVATNPTVTDSVATPSVLATVGTYYAYYFDAANNCYSPASVAVTVTINTCNQSPVITSAATATTPENVSISTLVYTATATDPNSGQTQTFAFETGGVDNAKFTINATTGAVTFNISPDFEIPTDAGGNNVYDIKIKVCDNGSPVMCATKDVAITVTDAVEACPTASVGGTATYTGGTVCSTANMGTINLTGQTGNVLTWQTSINGGISWTDIAGTLNKTSYNFINAANNQQFRAVVNTNIVTCTDDYSSVVTITISATACTTPTCSYTSGSFSPTITTASNPSYTTHVILVNPTTGVIDYVTAANSTAFTGVAVGDYMMYAVTYDHTVLPIPTITVGTNITALTGCTSISDPLLTKVCCPTIAAPTVSITQPICGATTGTIAVTAPSSGVTYSFDNGTTYQASATSSALAAGATYQVLVKDNSSNCVSTSTPSVLNAVLAVPSAPTVLITQPTCSVTTGIIAVTAPSSGVTYSFDNGTTFQASATSSALAAGATYQVLVKDTTSNCVSTSTPSVLNAVLAVPSAPTVSITQPACGATTGTIAVTAPSSGVTYSFDNGTTYQASATSSALTAGATYQVLVKDNSSNCVSPSTPSVLNGILAVPSAPTVSITQPTCSVATGLIEVTAPSSGVIYSFDNGTTFQASATSSALAAGATYQVLVKDTTSNCVSAATPSVLNAVLGAPSAPTVSMTQPTCSVTTGLITVTAPSSGVTYSFDNGTTYQASATSSALTAGATYQVIVKDNSTNCVSSSTPSVLNGILAVPNAPTVSITQPNCSATTGTIAVTAPSSGVTYSFDNGATYQASATSSALAADSTYQVLVKDNSSNCVSPSTPSVLTAILAVPSAPIATITQPTCNLSTGSITITSPSTNVSYSFNNGVSFQPFATTSNLTSGNYQLMVKDNTSSCTSTAASATINAPLSPPSLPTLAVNQPNCTVGTGTITVTSPSSGVTYSFDNGATFQASHVKSGLTAGTYLVVVKDTVSGCSSLAKNVLINNSPTTGCNCDNATGIISLSVSNQNTAPAYTQQYLLTDNYGLILQISNAPSFTGLTSNQYAVYAINYETSSGVTGLTIGQNIAVLNGACLDISVPLFSHVCLPVFTCNNTSGTITAIVSGQNTDAAYTQKYVLTNELEVIQQIATTPIFTGLVNGKYKFYAINYNTASGVTGLTVGQNIALVNGSCVNKSAPLVYQVCQTAEICNNQIDDDGDGLIDCEDAADCTSCGCDNTTGNITFTNTGQTTTVGYTQVYVLTDSTATILKVSSAQTFTGLSSGRYRVYAINYETVKGITGLTVGQKVDSIRGICTNTSLPLLFKVCLCVTFDIKAILEGPYQTATQLMQTTLNQRGLLPGQTPIGQFGTPTPQGQPYKGAPWNYLGTEGDTITTYPSTVVDWVLVSLRTDSTTVSNVFRVTGWLHNDGHISFIKPCFDITNGSYFVVVEHRNHIGVMSPNKVVIQNGTLAHDFTTIDSYVMLNPPSFGQKLKGTKWVLYAGDGKKDTYTTNYDVNFFDSQLWKLQSGIFDQYKFGDFDMNADVNFLDNYLWKFNSGKYSGVPH